MSPAKQKSAKKSRSSARRRRAKTARRPRPARRSECLRAPRCRRRSRRSRTTPSSPTAIPARWWRPTGRSTGSACRGSTRPASSGRCSTAKRAAFRFAPFGINVPSNRIYEPGTNVLNTTWHTPTGWAMVRDALTIGPDPARGRGHPAHARARRRGRSSHARANGALHGGLGRHGAALRAGSSTTGAHPPSGRYRADTPPTRAERG